ncbi:hypothetical protein CSUB01_04461, partial [Colletotrichum sublineola]
LLYNLYTYSYKGFYSITPNALRALRAAVTPLMSKGVVLDFIPATERFQGSYAWQYPMPKTVADGLPM